MKKTLMGVMLAFAALALNAAEGEWLTDFAKAKAQAKAENKLVLLDFTGSDWCPPCIQLHNRVFTQEEFKKFAQEKLVLVEVDFPRRKEQSPALKEANEALQKQFKVDAFPTVVLVNPAGKELGRQRGYGGDSPAEFIGKIQGWMKKG